MKKTITLLALVALASGALADEYVRGYVRKDGTYVEPHFRSSPDSDPYNNYSSPGNTNPYTGRTAPDSSRPSSIEAPQMPSNLNNLNNLNNLGRR